jgi:predicted ATPase
MESIQARKLRCLADTGAVELKPITLLVGANSSGKSSFIRIFPLLKQSAESKTLSGLLLNEGDVNFGFFDETIHKHADPSELEFEFAFKLRKGIHHGARLNNFLTESMDVECKLQYAKRSKDPHYPYLKSIEIRLKGQNPYDSIELIADESGRVFHFRINEYDAIQDVPTLKLKIGRGIVPQLSRSLVCRMLNRYS